MSEHVVVNVDHVPVTPPTCPDGSAAETEAASSHTPPPPENSGAIVGIGEQKSLADALDTKPSILESATQGNESESSRVNSPCSEGEPKMAECRICQEEDHITNLESPCACSGSLKFAHRKCVQRWCNEKGDIICEICRKPFESGYTAPHPVQDNISINVGVNWDVSSSQQADMHEPRFFAMSAEHQFLDNEYAGANARSAACFRSIALILIALLLLRHLLSMAASDSDDDKSTFFMLFVLRAAGFLLPFYIMARAFSALQYRNQPEETALGPAEVAYLIQAGHARGVRIALSPGVSA